MSEVKNLKVIAVSNYDDETMNDSLICDNVNEYYGKIIVDRLNSMYPEGRMFYKLVPQDTKLYVWEP